MLAQSILKGFLADFSRGISELSEQLISAAVEIYNRVSIDLLPTPAKSHYVFNLRDLSKCVQGMLQADPSSMRDNSTMLRYQNHFIYNLLEKCILSVYNSLVNNLDIRLISVVRSQCK